MQAVILAAGLGTRMRELTKNTPKPMLKIGNRTLLGWNCAALPDAIDEVVVVVGYLADAIEHFLGRNWKGRRIVYVRQEELKGTGHALSLCRAVLHGKFLVIMGDDLYEKKDLERLVREPLAMLVMEIAEHNEEENRSALVTVDADGLLTGIVERQPMKKGSLVNTGAYVLDERYFDYPLLSAGNPSTEFGLPQTLLQYCKDGVPIRAVKATWWRKIGVPEDLVG